MQAISATAGEYEAAILQTVLTLGVAALCAFLARRYRKPYLAWFALAWALYLLRLLAIDSFLASRDWIWLYWHQVATGLTGLVLLWAALVFSRRPRWRPAYTLLALFPVAWSYLAIYRLDNFLLAALPAVLFLSAATLATGVVFAEYHRRARSSGAALLAAALLLWGLHHLDYPFLRARGIWTPWGYYLDIVFTVSTAAGILLLLLDDLRRGLSALLAVSDDLAHRRQGDGLVGLLERLLALPAVRGSALYAIREGRPVLERGAGVSAAWPATPPEAEARLITEAVAHRAPRFAGAWNGGGSAMRYGAVLPVFDGAAATHALVIAGDARDPFAALDTDYLLALGQQIGAALHRDALYQGLAQRTGDLERLSRRMLQQHEDERRRLSLHLHDETAQLFTAVKLQLGVVLERQGEGPARDTLGRTMDLLDEGISSIRNITNDLRPSLLDDLGLLPAMRSLAADWSARTGITLALDAPDALPPMAPEAELALFRALQEALSNVAQHAGASRVAVRVAIPGGTLDLDIADDGRGFPAGGAVEGLERAGHLGLAGLRERITAVGGRVTFGVAPGGGARVTVHVPVAS